MARPNAAITFGRHHYYIHEKSCNSLGELAKTYGFNTVVFLPEFYFHSNDKRLGTSFGWNEIKNCLTDFDKLGLQIIYRPFIEPGAFETRNPGDPAPVWRAVLQMSPTALHQHQIFSEYFEWMKTANQKYYRVLIANEMYQSTNFHALAWNNLLYNVKVKMRELRPDQKIMVGVDPGALAPYHDFGNNEGLSKMNETQCKDFQNLLWSADFFGYSVYGDLYSVSWEIDVSTTDALLAHKIDYDIKNLSKSKGCEIPPVLAQKMRDGAVISETGFAGNIRESWGTNREVLNQPKGRNALVKWYQSLLASAQNLTAKNDWKFAAVWTIGDYDFFGFDKSSPLLPNQKNKIPHYSEDPELNQIRNLLVDWKRP